MHELHMLLARVSADPTIDEAIAIERAEPPPEGPGEPQPFPYDLLVTRSWMLLVPRTREAVDGIQLNSLGYAGAFLAKTEEEKLQIVRDPLDLLSRAATCDRLRARP